MKKTVKVTGTPTEPFARPIALGSFHFTVVEPDAVVNWTGRVYNSGWTGDTFKHGAGTLALSDYASARPFVVGEGTLRVDDPATDTERQP